MTVLASFQIPGEPVPKGRPRFTRQGRVYTPRATVDAEKGIAWRARMAYRGTPTTENVRVDLVFTCRRLSDLDNLVKLALDGMQGVVYANDSQVSEIHAVRLLGEDPHTSVTVALADPPEPA